MRNILLLSAGRRVELIQAFQSAFAEVSPLSKVIAADAQPLAPGLYHADLAIILPKVSANNFRDELVKAIREYEIDLVVPTIDPELPVLSHLREQLEDETGTRIMIAEPWVIDICNDKVLTQQHVTKNGLLAPKIYEDSSLIESSQFPLILKPRAGSSSIGVNIVNSLEELNYLLPATQSPMIQQLVFGDEFTADCFSDFEGKVISIVPRLRIATRGGEILKGRIVKDTDVIEAVRRLLESLPMPGHSTVQCFKTKEGVEFIEVNPRFGGGAPMSIAAGADSCKRLVELLNGGVLEYDESYEDGLTFLRFDQSIVLKDNELIQGKNLD
ncbi:ATP-grasp domain-containing protein [Corynebacterium callunae]|uniref:ATP-grasp domain-containing protein n=1 Tax=Corynebacterium callunae DSM 20147 TaxID=1121353 RepID=M1UX68_9CORY|nr:ATP-grasp domain-containing protein [Corynebacterium callunae]AGG65758.1 hypothetical protein H924_01520 [Corynebacterium callunae DSM 20147]